MVKWELNELLDEFGHAYKACAEHLTAENSKNYDILRKKIIDAVFNEDSELHSKEKEHRADRIHTNKVKPKKLMKSLDTYCNMYTLGPYVAERNGSRYVKYTTSPIPQFYKKMASRKFRRTTKHSSRQKSLYKKHFDYKWTVD